jgi:DNA-binding transcriptional ArsR family regulator
VASTALAQRAPVFAALGDETRLRIVSRLVEGAPLSITALSTGEPVTRQAITKHLRVLQEAGLVRSERRGREQLWELERTRLEELRAWVEDLSRQWDIALDKLKAYVEK